MILRYRRWRGSLLPGGTRRPTGHPARPDVTRASASGCQGNDLRVHDGSLDGIQAGALLGVVLRLIDGRRGRVCCGGGLITPRSASVTLAIWHPATVLTAVSAMRSRTASKESAAYRCAAIAANADASRRGRVGLQPPGRRLITSMRGSMALGPELRTRLPRLLPVGARIDQLRGRRGTRVPVGPARLRARRAAVPVRPTPIPVRRPSHLSCPPLPLAQQPAGRVGQQRNRASRQPTDARHRVYAWPSDRPPPTRQTQRGLYPLPAPPERGTPRPPRAETADASLTAQRVPHRSSTTSTS